MFNFAGVPFKKPKTSDLKGKSVSRTIVVGTSDKKELQSQMLDGTQLY